MVLCAASSYEEKYYLDPAFSDLPQQIKDELKSACVLFVMEAGGIIILEFEDDGELMIRTKANDSDFYYDEINAGLHVRRLQNEKRDLFESLELYYRVFFGGENE